MINSLEFIEDSELSIHSNFFQLFCLWKQWSSLEKTAADESRDFFRNSNEQNMSAFLFSTDNLQ